MEVSQDQLHAGVALLVRQVFATQRDSPTERGSQRLKEFVGDQGV